MAGHLQGIAMDQLEGLMSRIEDFAEIGDYMDQPVRTYSSGMQVRLAFSVATVVRPDILIVDEALSVGDIYFQQKCFDRIREFRDGGTTLLFVTHSLATIYNLCSRAMYIENGVVELDGLPKEVIDLYQARVVARSQKSAGAISVIAPVEPPLDPASEPAPPAVSPAENPPQPTGSYFVQGVTLESVNLFDAAGRATETFVGDQTMVIEVCVRFDMEVDDPHFGFQVRDRLGQALFMTTTHGLGKDLGRVGPGETRTVRFAFRPLIAPGQYTVTAGVANRGRFDGSFEEALVRHQDITSFTVVEPADAVRWAGMINLQPTVEIADAAGHH
jgi:lipopolysaccharide transport system ATP-binding protein